MNSLGAWPEQLQPAVDSLPLGLAVTDGEGLLVLANTSWHAWSCAHLGLVAGLRIGQPLLSSFDRPSGQTSPVLREARQGLERVLAREIPNFTLEVKSASGRGVRAYMLQGLWLAPGGGLLATLVETSGPQVGEDVHRLAMAGALASGIVHQLRNPLGAILLRAETELLAAQTTGAESRELGVLHEIKHEVLRAEAALKSLAQVTRGERTEAARLPVNEIVRRVTSFLELLANRRGFRFDSEVNVDEYLAPHAGEATRRVGFLLLGALEELLGDCPPQAAVELRWQADEVRLTLNLTIRADKATRTWQGGVRTEAAREAVRGMGGDLRIDGGGGVPIEIRLSLPLLGGE
jgi:signal transduction histidine kinase